MWQEPTRKRARRNKRPRQNRNLLPPQREANAEPLPASGGTMGGAQPTVARRQLRQPLGRIAVISDGVQIVATYRSVAEPPIGVTTRIARGNA